MSISKHDVRNLIEETLREANLFSREAVELLMLTAAAESQMGTYLKQRGGGPALGIFQMEPTTHDDIWDNFIQFRPKISEYLTGGLGWYGDSKELVWNLKYAIIMARVHYLRVPVSIPRDIDDMAAYWKKYYNTKLGKGTIEKAITAYKIYA